MTQPLSPLESAKNVLLAANPADKVAAANKCAQVWQETKNWQKTGTSSTAPSFLPIDLPDRPSRPLNPTLAAPSAMPKRRLSTAPGRFALLHAVAHIEFNAIDLAFDMAARFTPEIANAGLDPIAFVSDWVSVGEDEARHFGMISDRLADLGGIYGDLPAHDGLWEAAENTSDNAIARLAIAPMVLEARGLDVTPKMIQSLESNGDFESAAVLKVIYQEEVGHVAKGQFWFEALCKAKDLPPAKTFQNLVKERFAGDLKPPFNHKARCAAGMPQSFYASKS